MASPPGAWNSPAPTPPEYGAPRRSHTVRNVVIAAAVVLVVLVIVGVVVGTTSHSSNAPGSIAVAGTNAADTPQGYQTFVDQPDRFSLAVPSTWREINPSSPGAADAFQAIQDQNPNLKSALGGTNLATMAASGMKFFSMEPSPEGGFASNINVVVHSALGIKDSDLGELQREAATEYAKAGATVSSTSTVALAGHKALRETIQFTMKNPSGNSILVPEVQYFVGANDLLYVITLSGTAPDLDTVATTFQVH